MASSKIWASAPTDLFYDDPVGPVPERGFEQVDEVDFAPVSIEPGIGVDMRFLD